MSILPPPPNECAKLQNRSTPLQMLATAMGPRWTETPFGNFRYYIRELAQAIGLDHMKPHKNQDHEKWDKLCKTLSSKIPDVAKYHDYWPVVVYYNRWSADRVHAHLKASKGRRPPRPTSSFQDEESDSEDDSDTPLSAILGSQGSIKRETDPNERPKPSKHVSIARPNKNLTGRHVRLEEIQEAMGRQWKGIPYEKFKNFLRTCALQTGLDSTQRHERQDGVKWTSFTQKMVKEFPDLAKYDGHWPVDLSFDRWVAEHLHCTKTHGISTSNANPDSESSNDVPSSASVSIPTRRRRSTDSDSDTPETPAKRPARLAIKQMDAKATKKIFFIGENPRNFGRPSAPTKLSTLSDVESDRKMDSYNSNNSKLQSQRTLSSRAPHSPEPLVDAWPHWCAWCGIPPSVSPQYTTELGRLFPNKNIRDVLANIGILHDWHLGVLASKLTHSQQRKFLFSLVPEKLFNVQASEISEIINNFGGHGLPDGKFKVCARHENQHTVEVPSELENTLHELGMDELGPAVVFLGVDSNKRFQSTCSLNSEAKKMIFENMKGIKLGAFQKFMLQLALAGPS